MNIILLIFISGAVIFSIINGTHAEIFNIITDSLNDCSSLIIKIAFLTGFFSGLMKIAEKSGFTEKLSKILKPILKLIFKDAAKDEKALGAIVMNLTSRYIISPENMEQNEVDSFTSLLLASLENRDVKTENGMLKNILIMTVNKLNDIPSWFYRDNRIIIVPVSIIAIFFYFNILFSY